MACTCLCFFQGSKPWIDSLFASFSSGSGSSSIPVISSVILILVSALVFYTFSKQKQALVDFSELKTIPPPENNQENVQEKTLFTHPQNARDDKVGSEVNAMPGKEAQGLLITSQDLYSESESMDHFSSEEEGEDDHCSDIEWPYDIKQRIDCSDDSISDDESLIEIAIPTGQSVSPDKSYPEYGKLSAAESTMFQKHRALDCYADINEEDNLIEIDIYMGSIKCPSFGI